MVKGIDLCIEILPVAGCGQATDQRQEKPGRVFHPLRQERDAERDGNPQRDRSCAPVDLKLRIRIPSAQRFPCRVQMFPDGRTRRQADGLALAADIVLA